MADSKTVLGNLSKAVISFDSEALKDALGQATRSGIPVELIVKEGLGRGMEIVGEKYEKGEYFLSDLIMGGVVMNEAMERLRPMLTRGSSGDNATILIGTVEGDLHDIGKNLVKYMLESAGYNIVDLGTDVPPQKFAVETRKNRPAIVCMSALLSVTMPKVKETIDALGEAGVKDNTRVLVGGRCLTEEISKEMGADAYGRDCFDGLKKAKGLLKSK
ncbi:MAG: cobalamin-dependent protein [Candidatus Bathyarchaeia archaeon]|jgi:5-methyltetrahydrofolate--homocysteine methyltransferase